MLTVPNPNTQNIVSFIHSRRPSWQFIPEDQLLRVMCNQFTIDWAIIEQLKDTYKVEVRDVISHAQAGIVLTIIMPGDIPPFRDEVWQKRRRGMNETVVERKRMKCPSCNEELNPTLYNYLHQQLFGLGHINSACPKCGSKNCDVNMFGSKGNGKAIDGAYWEKICLNCKYWERH